MAVPFSEHTSLGGGIRGVMPQKDSLALESEFARTRFVLRNVWNVQAYGDGTYGTHNKAIGNFRAVNNAGDILSRANYSCGGGNQLQSRPNLRGLQFGGIHSTCDGTHVPPSTCNVKYVYDSSDFTKFRRQQAVNRNYNDRTFGGDQSNAGQVAMAAARR
jgi:hypothetical protein